jgi:predicted ATPase
MARLTSLGVRGFKSIKDLQPLELRPVNVLVGANGAGKSNLISFFRLLNAIPAGKLQEFVGRAGGASTLLWYGSRETLALWADVGFEGKAGGSYYRFGLTSTDTDTLIFEDEYVASPIVAHSRPKLYNLGSGQRESLVTSEENGFGELRSLLAGIQVFHFEDTSESAAIRRRGYIEDNRQLHHDAGNLAAFLYGLLVSQPSYYRRIVSAIQQIAPFFEDFDLSPLKTDANSILLNWRDRGSTQLFGPHQLSDGTLRTMALVALLAQPESDLPSVIVIDEPEIGLHPYALEIVAALVKSASVHCTIVLATQSVGLVNHFAPEDIVTVTRDTAQTKFERQNSETLSVWLEDYGIGEIWERNLIGGNPSR